MTLQGIPRRKRALYCSFCGKGQDEVFKLVASPQALICDECIAAAQMIVTDAKIAAGCSAVIGKMAGSDKDDR